MYLNNFPFQLPSVILHLSEADPAPDHQLHRDPEVVAGRPHLPQQLPAEAQGLRLCGEQHPNLSAGPHQAGGRVLHVFVEHRH